MTTVIKRYLQEHFALPVVCSNPTAPVSGNPVRYGELTGIALTDEGGGGNAATETSVYFGACVVDVSVKGVDGSGNSAVALGDTIYYVDADTPKLSKKAAGYFFGFAMETVAEGATATINVLKLPGGSNISSVGTSDLAAGAVTAAKLSTTLKTGFIPVSLASVREITTGAFINAAGNGGLLATDTTPILNTINGDTDGAWRINWAATIVDAIGFQVPLPPDLDEAANVEIHLRAAMAAANDTPVISADSYFDEGDTKVEDDSTAITGATFAEYTISIAAADVPAGAQTHPRCRPPSVGVGCQHPGCRSVGRGNNRDVGVFHGRQSTHDPVIHPHRAAGNATRFGQVNFQLVQQVLHRHAQAGTVNEADTLQQNRLAFAVGHARKLLDGRAQAVNGQIRVVGRAHHDHIAVTGCKKAAVWPGAAP